MSKFQRSGPRWLSALSAKWGEDPTVLTAWVVGVEMDVRYQAHLLLEIDIGT